VWRRRFHSSPHPITHLTATTWLYEGIVGSFGADLCCCRPPQRRAAARQDARSIAIIAHVDTPRSNVAPIRTSCPHHRAPNRLASSTSWDRPACTQLRTPVEPFNTAPKPIANAHQPIANAHQRTANTSSPQPARSIDPLRTAHQPTTDMMRLGFDRTHPERAPPSVRHRSSSRRLAPLLRGLLPGVTRPQTTDARSRLAQPSRRPPQRLSRPRGDRRRTNRTPSLHEHSTQSTRHI
jgi:hypothetical protein